MEPLTDAGKPRKRDANNLGWRKNQANADIRDAMKAKGIGQAKLGEIVGKDAAKICKWLKDPNLAWNIHDALLETVKRYDPVTNPKGL